MPNPSNVYQFLEAKKTKNDFCDAPTDAIIINSEALTGAVTLIGGREHQEDRLDAGKLNSPRLQLEDYKKILNDSVALLNTYIFKGNYSKEGSTLCAALLRGKDIVSINLGDSTMHLCEVDAQGNVMRFTRINENLHHPSGGEKERLARGHYPVYRDRLNGSINIARAIGDYEFDQYGMLHEGDVYFTTGNPDSSVKTFIITASDGLTEQNLLTDEMIQAVIKRNPEASLETIAKSLGELASELGSCDNITVSVTQLTPEDDTLKYIAVFDGHGGDDVSHTLREIFEPVVQTQIHKVTLQQYLQSNELNDVIKASLNELLICINTMEQGIKRPSAGGKMTKKNMEFYYRQYYIDFISDTHHQLNYFLENLTTELANKSSPLSILPVFQFLDIVNAVDKLKQYSEKYADQFVPFAQVNQLLETLGSTNIENVAGRFTETQTTLQTMEHLCQLAKVYNDITTSHQEKLEPYSNKMHEALHICFEKAGTTSITDSLNEIKEILTQEKRRNQGRFCLFRDEKKNLNITKALDIIENFPKTFQPLSHMP